MLKEVFPSQNLNFLTSLGVPCSPHSPVLPHCASGPCPQVQWPPPVVYLDQHWSLLRGCSPWFGRAPSAPSCSLAAAPLLQGLCSFQCSDFGFGPSSFLVSICSYNLSQACVFTYSQRLLRPAQPEILLQLYSHVPERPQTHLLLCLVNYAICPVT